MPSALPIPVTTVATNWGLGYVAATVQEPGNGPQSWAFYEPVARALGADIPAVVETVAFKPQLIEAAGERGVVGRTPFYRRMPKAKRGRRN